MTNDDTSASAILLEHLAVARGPGRTWEKVFRCTSAFGGGYDLGFYDKDAGVAAPRMEFWYGDVCYGNCDALLAGILKSA